MKIDIRKAYDSVRWDFLKGLLIALKFPNRFVSYILVCVETVTYVIVLNGESSEFFPGRQGLR